MTRKGKNTHDGIVDRSILFRADEEFIVRLTCPSKLLCGENTT